jgi:tetratricopeptide (TPR) repeat protein
MLVPRRPAVAPRLATTLAAVGALLWAPAAQAQNGPEFTRQGMYVATFTPEPGLSLKLGRDAGDEVRDRLDKLVKGRDAEVLSFGAARKRLVDQAFVLDTVYPLEIVATIARGARADEFVVGRVGRRGAEVVLTGELRLLRDPGSRQPITASAPRLEAAADQFARAVAAARAQLPAQRRCANAVQRSRHDEAVRVARAGLPAYARGAFLRACLVGAMRVAGAPATELLTEARELLGIDSLSRQGLEGAARALDVLRRREEAGEMWARLVTTDSINTSLLAYGVRGLLEGGNAARAEPIIAKAVVDHPEEIELLRLRWHVAFETRNWAKATESGEALLRRDSTAAQDSSLFVRLATAHRNLAQPVRALELAARGVSAFPNDPRVYAVYAELVRQEMDTVVPRGLARFPKSAELNTLAAREARAQGRLADAAAATRRAVDADSALPQGLLSLAQAEFDLGRPDSAFVAVGRALARGEDSTLVAQFALAKGNALLRAAGQTKARGDYARALRFLGLADGVRATPQSKFLRGTAALQVASAALREASAEKDRVVGCALAREGSETVATARAGLTAGQELAPDAAKQYLEYVAQLEPFAQRQLATLCAGVAGADAPSPVPGSPTR